MQIDLIEFVKVFFQTIIILLPIIAPLMILAVIMTLLERLAKGKRRSPKNKKQTPKQHEKSLKKLDKIYGTFTMSQVDKMTGAEFELLTEKLIKVVYQDQVLKTENTPASGDQGCDIVVHLKSGLRMGVQCKRYSNKVDNKAVQNIVASKPIYGLSITMVVTNNYFTPGALEAGRKNKVTMVNREEFQKWINIYNDKLKIIHARK